MRAVAEKKCVLCPCIANFVGRVVNKASAKQRTNIAW